MKKSLILILSSVILAFFLVPSLGAAFEAFLIDFSIFENKDGASIGDGTSDEDLEDADVFVHQNEPVLIEVGHEEGIYLRYEDRPKIRSFEAQTQFLKLVKEESSKSIHSFINIYAQKIYDSDSDLRKAEIRRNIVISEDVSQILIHYGFLHGNNFPEMDNGKGKKSDYFKCVLHPERDFVAIVEFEQGNIALKAIGVCQQFFDRYMISNNPGEGLKIKATKSLLAFLLGLSGHGRIKGREIMGLN